MNSLFYMGLIGGILFLILGILLLLDAKNVIHLFGENDESSDKEKINFKRSVKIIGSISVLFSGFLLFIAYSLFI